jgi:hypothetical protein
MKQSSLRYARAFSTIVAIGITTATTACDDNSSNTAPLIGTTVTINTGSDAQTGTAGQALAQPISVHVVDQNGAAFAGASITWTVMSGAGTVSAATSTTNATGDATTIWTLGNTAGADSLKADLGNGSSVIIAATALAGPFASLSLVSGDAQSVTAGTTTQPLVVKAVDTLGNPVANATVTWAVTGGGVLSATSSTTDATGMASVTLATDANPATYTVSATSGTVAAITFTVTGM